METRSESQDNPGAPAAAEPSPALLFDTIVGYQRSAAIKAAVELDLFTAIGEGHETPTAIAQRLQTSERGIRILCDFLTIHGFLTKDASPQQSGSSYRLTADSALFLDRRSPAYMGSVTTFLLSPMLTDAFQDLTAAVRQGGTRLPEEGSLAPEHPAWVEFARAMMPMMMLPARLLADRVSVPSDRPVKVLDIAAGHGIFGILLAQRHPNVEVVAVDWPNVLEVARENARAFGVGDRYRTLPGSAFEVDYGSGGYDVALLTNFLHHFDPPTNEALLRKVHGALREGGQAVTLEFVPNEDRISPPPAASFSLIMLATTPQGDAYTFSELQAMFRSAGFSESELHPLPPSIQQAVVISRR